MKHKVYTYRVEERSIPNFLEIPDAGKSGKSVLFEKENKIGSENHL